MKKAIFLVFAVLFFSGCMTTRFDVSRPKPYVSGNIKVKDDGNIIMPGLRMTIKPYNFDVNASAILFGFKIPKRFDGPVEHAFFVEMAFLPKASGFSFDPSGVELNAYGKTLKPVASYGPEYDREVYLTSLFCFKDFKKAFLDNSNFSAAPLSSALELEKGKWSGVLLKFEIYPPSPEEAMSLTLSGLERDGSRVEVPEINFQKGYAVEIDDLVK